jgi:hypothetical protein
MATVRMANMKASAETQTDQMDPEEPIYSICSVAQMLGVSVFTLRMYEREGLIVSHKADSTHQRYSQNDVDRIKCIRRAIRS